MAARPRRLPGKTGRLSPYPAPLEAGGFREPHETIPVQRSFAAV